MTDLREKKKPSFGIFKNFSNFLNINTLLTILISLSILAIAIYCTSKIATWIHSNIGQPFEIHQFNYTWTHTSNITESRIRYFEIYGDVNYYYTTYLDAFNNWTNPSKIIEYRIWYFEIYGDSSYYYTAYLDAFIDWWNPYKRYVGPLDYYLYGPMFIYGLYFTYLFVSLFNPSASRELLVQDAVKWTAINFEALSAVMVYLIILNFPLFKKTKVKKHLYGILGAFTCVFMPMNLLYLDSYYLNTPQMTFFTLLTIFLFLKKRYRLSAYSLSIAWLTKQIPLFLLIPLFSYIWKTYDLRKAFKEFLKPFLVSFLIFSIPWIILTPHLYIGRIFAAGRSLWYVDNSVEALKHGVTFANTILYLGSQRLATFYIWINIPMIPFLLFYGLGLFVGHFNAKKIGRNDSVFIYYITWLLLIVHTFISRGIFKYYDPFLNPFLVLSSIFFIENIIQKMRKIKPINSSKGKSVLESSEPLSNKIFWTIITIMWIVILIGFIYGINWSIMTTIRFLHPVFLLGVTLLLSPLIPSDYYREVFKKESWKQLKEDFKEFFRYIKESFKGFFSKLKGFFKRKQQNKGNDK